MRRAVGPDLGHGWHCRAIGGSMCTLTAFGGKRWSPHTAAEARSLGRPGRETEEERLEGPVAQTASCTPHVNANLRGRDVSLTVCVGKYPRTGHIGDLSHEGQFVPSESA
jgi:hypothetical protein